MTHILLTGSSGMVGKGILLESLEAPEVKSVTLLNRSAIDIKHPKLKEIILPNFLKIASLKDQFQAFDACIHCMGVSAMGHDEESYSKLTFSITQQLTDLCFDYNPKMTFIYVSGMGTDSTEKSRQMWARVKGRTENYILKKGFAKAVMFRPGFIIPEKGIRSKTQLYNTIYRFMRPFFPLFKKFDSFTTTTNIGKAMLQIINSPELAKVPIENKQINRLAKQYNATLPSDTQQK